MEQITPDNSGLELVKLTEVIPTTIDCHGNEIVNWVELLPRPATKEVVTEYLMLELQPLIESENPVDQKKADRIIAASDFLLKRAEQGQLETIGDISTLVDLIGDSVDSSNETGVSLKRISQFLDKGYSANKISFLYEARDIVGASMESIIKLVDEYGISLDDQESLEMLSDAIQAVITNNDLKFYDTSTAVSLIIEYSKLGQSLSDIVYSDSIDEEEF